MSEMVNFGLSNVHFSSLEFASGAYTFQTPEAHPGSINLKMDANFETTEVYADNTIYYVTKNNKGYDCALEVVMLKEDFEKKYLGFKTTADGEIVETSDGKFKDFALLFQVETDEQPNKYILYRNSITKKPSYEFKTLEDKTEIATVTIEFKSLPLMDGSKAIKAKCPPTAKNYATYFTTAPKSPTFTEAGS